MKLSAFTLIKNAIKFDYPVIESINSLLPYVDEYIVNVGRSMDGTEALIARHYDGNPKVKLYFTDWEDKSSGTAFFSNQTQFALDKCSGDWVFYLQADECVHEDYAAGLRETAEHADKKGMAGVTFRYLHFEKSPFTIRKTYEDGFDAYDKEIRMFKNNGQLISFGDAQSFCFVEDFLDPRGPQPALHRGDRFLESDNHIFHYGYLKDPKKLLVKKTELNEFYNVTHPDRHEVITGDENGNYVFSEASKLKEFKGIHPLSMQKRLQEMYDTKAN